MSAPAEVLVWWRPTSYQDGQGIVWATDHVWDGGQSGRHPEPPRVRYLRADLTTEWFWRIVDANGPPGLPSDEGEALRILMDSWRRRNEADPPVVAPPATPDAPVSGASGWQPINTAPAEQLILVYSPYGHDQMTATYDPEAEEGEGAWSTTDGYIYGDVFTHWQPLPEPPEPS